MDCISGFFCSLDTFWYGLVYKPGLDCLRYENYVLFLEGTCVFVQALTNGRFGAKAELQQEDQAGLFSSPGPEKRA